MATTDDRLEELIDGARRDKRTLISPEGVPLGIIVAGRGERLTAFAIDVALQLGSVVLLALLVVFLLSVNNEASVTMTLILFFSFCVRTLYFIHFELAWQGRTPGKRVCGLRVINRDGGELTPGAVIARNLTREVEFFLPLSLMLSLDADGGIWSQMALLGWVIAIASLPLWTRDRLRIGDLIGGTGVIAMPKRVLLRDLAAPAASARREADAFVFSHKQLAIYGALELQVLEELLRRRPGFETSRLLEEVCGKIRRKIDWKGDVPPDKVRRFLTDFYSAERENLERDQLYGRLRADKTGAMVKDDDNTKK